MACYTYGRVFLILAGKMARPLKIKMEKEKQIAFIKRLVQCDHSFMSKEFCDEGSLIFGQHIPTYLAKADPPGTFKGLTFSDGRTEMEGQDADRIAEVICSFFELEYTPMFGRGSRLRECCRAILEHLEK